MKPFVLAYATTSAAWARRLDLLARKRGWELLAASDPKSLWPLIKKGQFGLIMADWEDLEASAGAARKWVGQARRNAPNFSVMLVAEAACFGARLSRMLATGADGAMERSLSDEDLSRRLLGEARRRPRQAAAFLQSPGGAIRLDRAKAEVLLKSKGRWKSASSLSSNELRLLAFFLENPDSVLPRAVLLELMRPGRSHEVYAEAVDKHVEALRRKLGPFGRCIATVYGSGYRFTD